MEYRKARWFVGLAVLLGAMFMVGFAAVSDTAASPPSASEQAGGVQITFTAEPAEIDPGGCATLKWSVSGPHFMVALDGEPVADEGTKQVCPVETTEYMLEVDTGETMEVRRVTVQVTGAPGPEGGVPEDEPVDPAMFPPASSVGGTVPDWSAAQAKHVSVVVEGSKVGAPISPYVYSTFIEHQGRCIYGGIWAEMLQDRKFYYPINWYFPWGHRKLKSPWFANASDTVVLMDDAHAYVGEHCPEVFVDGVAPRGIVQRGLGLRAGKDYTGYVILSAMGNVNAEVSLVWGPGPGDRQTVSLGAVGEEYAKFPIKFTAGADTDDGRLEIVGSGRGQLFIGPPSLMPADNVEGMRADTLALLKQLGFTLYRWPGGTFATGYDWKKAIGDRDKRPPMLNNCYWSEDVESNDFGLDEFMNLCELVGAEAYIAVSAETEKDAQLAADEVAYLNGAADTEMGKLRASNGHPEPYNVRFFGVGNEMWYMPLDQYIPIQNDVAEAMWAVDPTIELIAVGGCGMTGKEEGKDWSYGMLEGATDYMTLLSEHLYSEFDHDLLKHTGTLAGMTRGVAELHRKYRKEITELQGEEIKLALDEWNYGWFGRPEIYGEAAPRYYFRDALGIARGLHAVFANSDLIAMVNLHAVNVHGQVKTTKTAAAIEATGLAWSLYRHHFGTLPLATGGETDPLDISVAWTADKDALTVAVVNPTQDSYALELTLHRGALSGTGGEWWYISAPPWAYNAPGQESQVRIQHAALTHIGDGLPVPPLSVNIYVLPAGSKGKND